MMQQQVRMCCKSMLYFCLCFFEWLDDFWSYNHKAEGDAASGLWDFGGGDLIKYPAVWHDFWGGTKALASIAPRLF